MLYEYKKTSFCEREKKQVAYVAFDYFIQK